MSKDRLDEETERRIMDVMLGGYNSVSELRQRIRVLVEEARKEDAERLDWLDAKGSFSVALNRHDGRQTWMDTDGRPVFLRLWLKDRGGENQSLREALDEVRGVSPKSVSALSIKANGS